MSKKSFQDLFKVTNPCSQDWNAMKGNNKVRFCEHCALEVNNLSAMRRKDAIRLVHETEGRICVRYVKNPSNKNKPVFTDNLYQIGRRVPRLAAGAMTAALSFSAMTYAQGGIAATTALENQTGISQKKSSEKDKTESATTNISGTISDPTGAVIPGVILILTGEKDMFDETATSNDEGFYEFKNLAQGNYKLKAEGKNGFKTFQTEITVSRADELKSDITMEVDGMTVTVGAIGIVEYRLPLLQAVAEDNVEEIKLLLGNGVNVNGKDKDNGKITALFVAVETGNIEIVRTLLDFGAKINTRDEDKRSPLTRLDSDATPELVKLLLSYGAKVKAIDDEGNNVLHHTVAQINTEVLQILINEGASIDVQNKEGQTPLMIAAENENFESVKAFLNAGANAHLRDKEGKTALGVALENEYTEIAELLTSFGAKE